MEMSAAHPGGLFSMQSVVAAQRALAEGKALPFSYMGTPDIHQFDLETIFKTSWQAVCAADSVSEPGSVFISRLGDIPIVVVRAQSGALRGFINVCRHRAYPVALEDGRVGRLTCRYHGWTYSLDGDLISAPEANTDEQSTYRCLSLLPVSVSQWRGIVFAHPDADAPQLADSFPGLDDIAADCDFDLSAYSWIRRLDVDIPSDWKLVYDNVVECYHCPSMHARTLNTLYEASGFDDVEWHGRIRKVEARMKGSDQLHHTIQLFPGTYLVMDPSIGIVGRFYPAAPGQTKLEFHFLKPPGAEAEESEHYAEMWCRTMHEDGEILKAQATGISAMTHGYLVSGPETSVIGVQQLILDAYRQAIETREGNHGVRDATVS
jgi:choline monooxygenase